MVKTKWFKSKTLWAVVAAQAALIGGLFSGNASPLLVLVGSLLNAVAVYGRSVASGPLN